MCVLRKVLCNEVVWIEAAQAAELWAGRCRGGKSKFTVGAEVRAGEVVDWGLGRMKSALRNARMIDGKASQDSSGLLHSTYNG